MLGIVIPNDNLHRVLAEMDLLYLRSWVKNKYENIN